MAHSTDYASMKDISRLKLSTRTKIASYHGSHGDTLVHNFIRENTNWAIDSLITYCLKQYSDFGVDRAMIAKHINAYVLEN